MNLILSARQTMSQLRAALSPWNGLYLLLSLLINLGLGYALSPLYTFAFAALLIVLANRFRRTQRCLILVSTLTAAAYYPFGQAYGPPNFNTLLSLHATNMAEASEIAAIFPWHSYLVAVFILVVGLIAFRRPLPATRKGAPFEQACLVFTVAAALTQPISNATSGGVFSLTDIGFPVVRFVKDTVVSQLTVQEELTRMNALASLQDSWQVTSVHPSKQVYVIVIGESARRDALGAFGGRWANTPWMSEAKGQLFVNYTSAASSTQKSLGITLNRLEDGKPLYQDNIITLANRAGFSTYWFSNQGQIGQYDTPIASIARRADYVHFLKEGDFEADKSTTDNDLLTLMPQALKQPLDKPRLIVLHLMGSHPKTCDRTGGHYDTYFQSPELSCYLYTMTQTDRFLQQLWEQLHSSGLSYSMIYFSDHGLAIKGRGTKSAFLAHDDHFQQNFDVPFFITSSGDTQHQVYKVARSANDFLKLFVQWTGITTPQIKPDYRFISRQKAPPIYVTNFKLQRVDYRQLKQDPLSR